MTVARRSRAIVQRLSPRATWCSPVALGGVSRGRGGPAGLGVYLGAGGLVVVLGAAPRGAVGAGDPLASAGRLVGGEAVLGGDDGELVVGAGPVLVVRLSAMPVSIRPGMTPPKAHVAATV